MRVLIFRLVGCAVGLWMGCLLFGMSYEIRGMLIGIVLLTLLYTFLRPVISILIMPLNMFLFGALSLLIDALLVLWVSDMAFAYWQALFVAAVIAVCFIPYSLIRKGELVR